MASIGCYDMFHDFTIIFTEVGRIHSIVCLRNVITIFLISYKLDRNS